VNAETDAAPMDGESAARFDKLRTLRLQLARERQLPPYCICHDSTLKLIARQAPGDLGSLERIKGMGPHKIKMYGNLILQTLGNSERTIVPVDEECRSSYGWGADEHTDKNVLSILSVFIHAVPVATVC